MLRCGATAAAENIEEAAACELGDDRCGLLRRFVILAEFVGQARIRVRGNILGADAGQSLDVGAQLGGAEGAVEADREWFGVGHRIVEGLRSLAGQGAAGGVGNGAGNHDWQFETELLEQLVQRIDGCLGIQRVENGLDHNQVAAAFDQCACSFDVVVDQLLKGHVARAGIVHIRGDTGRARGWTDDAGHPAGFVGGGHGVGGATGHCGGGAVQFGYQILHVVVRLGQAGRIEGIGLDDIGPGFHVFPVQALDQFRLGKAQQVVIALQVLVEVRKAFAPVLALVQLLLLDHGAHGAIQDQDALGERGVELLEAVAAGLLGHGRFLKPIEIDRWVKKGRLC